MAAFTSASNTIKISTTALTLSTVLLGSTPAMAQDWCYGKVTDRDSRIVEKVSRPAHQKSYIDPAFGTRVTRVTNAPTGSNGEAHRTLYNTVQPWNANETRLILNHTNQQGTSHHLYDGKTYQYLKPLPFIAADIEGIYWDEGDSSLLYFVQAKPSNDALYGKLVKYNIDTGKRTLLADLDPLCGAPASRGGLTVKGGNDIQGMASNNIGLRCQNDAASRKSSDITFYVDTSSGKISSTVALDPTKPQGSNSFGFSPNVGSAPMHSGNRVLVQDSVFDASMNFLYKLDGAFNNYKASDGRLYPVPKLEHAAIGQSASGHDMFFSSQYNPMKNGCDGDENNGTGALVAQDIQSGACRVLIGSSTGWNYPLSGTHVSAVSQNNRDWVTSTTIGYDELNYLNNDGKAPLLFSELYLTKADLDNPTSCRIAHLRTMGKSASKVGNYRKPYFGEPHAVMSPTGTRVLFNSDWYGSGSVDTYAVDLDVPGPNGVSVSTTITADSSTPSTAGTTSNSNNSNKPKNTNNTSDTDTTNVASSTTNSIHLLETQVRMQESPPRVYVDFVDTNKGVDDRIAISVAGTPDSQHKMWLFTNGSQKIKGLGPETGRLGFLQQYIGRGNFEARLFTDGNFDKAVMRKSFSIP